MTTSGLVSQDSHGANQFALGCETIQATATVIITQHKTQSAQSAATLAMMTVVFNMEYVRARLVNIKKKTEHASRVPKTRPLCLAVLV
jgi:hypothetical protein